MVLFRNKIKETLKEEKDRESRKTNVVVFGLDESTSFGYRLLTGKKS